MKIYLPILSLFGLGLVAAAVQTAPTVVIGKNLKSYPVLVKPNRPGADWQEKLVRGVMSFESFHAKPYLCPAGVLTVGYGHTGKYANTTMTPARAEQVLRADIEQSKQLVLKYVHVPLTEHQLASLTSFTFNCGEGSLAKLVSGKGRLNAGNYDSVERMMPQYVHADGKKLRGLQIRRGWEVSLWKGFFTI